MLPRTTRSASRRRRAECGVEGTGLSAGCDAGWFWRWGAPLIAALAALAALGCAAARWWWWDDAPFCGTRTWRSDAVTATVFAAALLVFRTIARCEYVDRLSGHGREMREGRDHRRCLAAAAIAACIVQAAYYLDVRLRYNEALTTAVAMQSFGVAASKYDVANNHVLHTLLVWVAHEFGDLNRVVLRMPAFLSFCLLLPMLWRFVRREYSAVAAGFATVFVGASWYFVFYATAARGYTLLLLLFVVALSCGQVLVRSPDRRALWAIWTVAIAAGIYTIPLMVFPAALTAFWMLLVRRARTGGRGLRPFALRTAAWAAVALVLALLLYLPIIVGDGVQKAILSGTYDMHLLDIVGHPVVLWHGWHLQTPPWARGVLLALVVVGATARSRSCGNAGTLLLAAGLTWALVLVLLHPVLARPRYVIWALLVFMILAGVGAACVFEGVMSRVRLRWPGVATARMRRVLEWVLLAVVFGAFSSWFSGGDLVRWISPRSFSSEITSSVASLMRPGDYFSVGIIPRAEARAFIRLHHTELPWQGVLWPPDASGWRAYRVSASTHRRAEERSPGISDGEPLAGRLFVFDLVTVSGRSRYFSRARTIYQYLEEHGADYEVVASFNSGMRAGGIVVYALSNWVPR